MDHIEKLNAKALEMRSLALSKVGMTPEDLEKLNMLPLLPARLAFASADLRTRTQRPRIL